MAEMVNPYIAGAPVTEARMFFGREDVFDWIQNSLTGRYADHILVIHGQRRVGKTSVLKQLGNRLPEKYIPVFFDLQGRTHTTLDRFLWWLARETVRVLKQDRLLEVSTPEKEDFARDPEYFENIFLPGLRPFLGKSNLLYTFDEFDNLEESEVKEELARPLIDHLRRLMGREEMSFIFSIGSSGRKLENMRAAYTDFFKTALYKKISFLSAEQTHNLVTRPVEGLLEYDYDVVRHIYELASGHPYFTQLTCHELFARCQQTGQRYVKDSDLDAILDDIVERGTVNLKFTWDEASDLEKWSLATLAQLNTTDNRHLSDYLRKQHVRFSDSELNSGLLHLREKDILTQENRFIIYLLKLWLQKNRPIEQVREELTEVNPIASRYIEIGLELRDSGQYEKAIESFREALAIAKDNIQAQVNIALAYMDQKEYDKAVIEFEKALVLDDEDVVARSGLCDVYQALGYAAMQMGRMKEAAQSYQRVLSINTEHTEARQRLAEINRQRAEGALAEGRDEEALITFLEALKYAPEDRTLAERVKAVEAEKKEKVLAALVARSEKEMGVKSLQAAVLTLEEAERLEPSNADIQVRLTEARAMLRENSLAMLRAKAQGFVKAEKYAEALKTWQEYLFLDPEDRVKVEGEVAHLQLLQKLDGIYGQVQEAISGKEYDKAIILLKEIILQDENFRDASRLLVQTVESRRSSRPARLTGLFSAILKGFFIAVTVIGLGIGGYFAWQAWGNNLTNLFITERRVEKVCFIMTGMDDARSDWNSEISQTLTDLAKVKFLDFQTFITLTTKEEREVVLTQMIKSEKCDLIFGNGTWLKDTFYSFAQKNSSVKFSLIDMPYEQSYRPLPENLIEQTFKTYDAGYLSGYLAAGLTKTGRVGTFGAEESVSVKEYMRGFVKGVEDYNKRHNTQMQSYGFNIQDGTGLFAGGYQRTDENRELHATRADYLINTENVDVLFIVSSPEVGAAGIEIALKANEKNDAEVMIIGVDTDWAAYFSGIPNYVNLGSSDWANLCITSARKNFDVMIKEVIRQAVEGTYQGETIEGNGSNLGVGLSPFNESLFTIPDDLKTDLAQLQYEAFGIIPQATATAVTPPTATADPRTFNSANQHLYLYIEQPASWREARDTCASQGGYLATIQDAEENEFVYQLTDGYSWLGATDEAEEGTWAWVSSEPWDYQNWDQGEPSNGSPGEPEHLLSFSGVLSAWNDVPEGNNSFVCEWEPAAP